MILLYVADDGRLCFDQRMVYSSPCPVKSHPPKNFSILECLAWFVAPTFLVPALLLLPALPCVLIGLFSSPMAWLDLVKIIVAEYGFVGLCTGVAYLLTFWMGKFFRPVLISAAACFILSGAFCATICSMNEFEGDREIFRPLTAEENKVRSDFFRDMFLVAGVPCGLASGLLGAGISAVIGFFRRRED